MGTSRARPPLTPLPCWGSGTRAGGLALGRRDPSRGPPVTGTCLGVPSQRDSPWTPPRSEAPRSKAHIPGSEGPILGSPSIKGTCPGSPGPRPAPGLLLDRAERTPRFRSATWWGSGVLQPRGCPAGFVFLCVEFSCGSDQCGRGHRPVRAGRASSQMATRWTGETRSVCVS